MGNGSITSWKIGSKKWKQWQILLSWAPKSLQMVTVVMKLIDLLLGRKAMTNQDSILKRKGITLQAKVYIVKPMVFPVVMYRCESWTIKNIVHWRIDAFELCCWRRLLRIPCTERSNQSVLKEINIRWIVIGRTDAEAEVPILWPPDMNSQLIGKDPGAGKDWRQQEKGMTEDEMVGWHNWPDVHP